ncbi:MAG: hypothetical protein JO110_06375, partial [Acetobacteraceae bacterium]|nr:hypothetical protein [Acetobacteraceae bacterium]
GVTRNGDVYKINPDKFSDAKKYLDLTGDMPGVVETRARLEIEGEQIAALWKQHRADIAETRQDFAADRESAWQRGQTIREFRQSDRELGEAVDTGSKAATGITNSLAKVAETVLGGIFSFFGLGEPKLTPDQAERRAQAAEERQEARAHEQAQAEREAAQHWIIEEARRRAAEREAGMSPESQRPKERDDSRGYERDRY